MTAKATAAYGTWPSPVSARMLAADVVGLAEPRLDRGVAYWLESRAGEGGRSVVVRADPSAGPVDVTPPGSDVRSRVHEYGGGSYLVADGVVVFSNLSDQRLYRQDPGAEPVPITPDVGGRDRFADGVLTPDGSRWIGVRERHEGERIADVVNELVAVPLDGSSPPATIVGGRDFYAAPRLSPDGARLSFLAWDLPWMPWDGCELHVAPVGGDGAVGEPSVVAGRDGEESIWQPTWDADGGLVFASDRSGWWNLERVVGDGRSVLHAAEAEFGYPQWSLGDRSFAFLGDGRIVCWYERDGTSHLAILDPGSGELLDLDLPYDAFGHGPHLDADGATVVFVAGSARSPLEVVRLDLDARSVDVLRCCTDAMPAGATWSVPRSIAFPTGGGETAHALFYPPASDAHEGPSDERPPLIVMSHGGPTGAATRLLDLSTQYWTTRGFAVVDVNYRGSTGYGRAYRERLHGAWGVVDLEDCVHAARALADAGDVDADRLLIRGGSAGGYTTICALTFTEVFAAGATYYGIADLVPFATGDTHKFEGRYEHTLVGPWPEAAERYRERSPINAVDRIVTPMLVLQGAEDRVVPPAQAEAIVAALRARKVPNAYLLFEGEAHGFRRAETIVRAREAELSFYAQVLGFEPGDPIPRLPIEHMASARPSRWRRDVRPGTDDAGSTNIP